MAPSYQTSIVSITKITDDTMLVVLEKPAKFTFKAGQYISIVLNNVHTGKITDSFHEFSIASSPDDNQLDILMRVSNSPFKTALFAMQPGDQVEIQGPFGNFTMPGSNKTHLVAGGIGITPFLSMLADKPRARVELWYFTSSTKNSIDLDSRIKNDVAIHEFVGRSNITKLNSIGNDSTVMIAGPPNFVVSAQETLLNKGVPIKQIITEEFTGYVQL